MPDSGIQVLDKASLMKADGSRLPPGSLRLKQAPLLSGNQPAAIQELHEVILRGGWWKIVRNIKGGCFSFFLFFKLSSFALTNTMLERSSWPTGPNGRSLRCTPFTRRMQTTCHIGPDPIIRDHFFPPYWAIWFPNLFNSTDWSKLNEFRQSGDTNIKSTWTDISNPAGLFLMH